MKQTNMTWGSMLIFQGVEVEYEGVYGVDDYMWPPIPRVFDVFVQFGTL